MNRTLTAGLLAVLLGCGGPKESERDHAKPHEHGHEGEERHEHSEEEESRLLHIDHDRLRDLRITTAPVESRPGGEGVAALGELQVDETRYAEVGSPMPARVVEAFVSPGENVREGAHLVELQSQELGNARSDYATARARLSAARKSLDRKKALHEERIVPLREVQESEAEVASLEASVQAARGALLAMGLTEGDVDGGQALGSRFILRSPVNGTVIERSAVRGQVTDPARPLFRVGDLSTLWLTVHAFERDALRIGRRVPARVAFPALPGQLFSGNVTLIGRQVDPHSRTIPVRVAIVNTAGVLRPGMSATAWLPVGDVDAHILSLPAAAIQRLQDEWVVFLPHEEEGTFEKRAVGRGRDLGGEVEILSGVAAGEKVVVDGAFLLKAEAEKARGEGDHHQH